MFINIALFTKFRHFQAQMYQMVISRNVILFVCFFCSLSFTAEAFPLNKFDDVFGGFKTQ